VYILASSLPRPKSISNNISSSFKMEEATSSLRSFGSPFLKIANFFLPSAEQRLRETLLASSSTPL